MEEKPITEEELEALEEMQEEQMEDQAQDNFENSQELQEAYGAPEPEERQNQHSFLHKSAFGSEDTLKTTYLNEWELGRPMFNIRFLLDMEDISKFYLDDLCKKYESDNRVSNYFKQKIKNITDSGMSKDGFISNLNVTKKMDSMRSKVRVNPIENLKGGKRK